MSYVKNYDVGQIKLDLPYANYIHELPLLSFGDVRHTVNLSLVYNSANSGENAFNIANGFKLNLQKQIKFTGSIPTEFVDENGKSVTILNNSGVYTFDDESQRIMRVREITVIPFDPNPKDDLFPAPMTDYIYTVEYPDFSKEEYNSSGKLIEVYDKYGSKYLSYSYSGSNLDKITYGNKYVKLDYSGSILTSISYIAGENAAEDEENIPTITFNFTNNDSTVTHYSGVKYVINRSAGYSIQAKDGTSVVKSLSVTTDTANKTIDLTDENGKSVTYSFSDPIDANAPSRMIDITDKNGVVTRVQFEGDEAVYSYELMDDEKMFIDYPYEDGIGDVYSGTVNMNKKGFSGTQGIDDGIKMGRGTNIIQYWKCIVPSTDRYYGDFLVSGWVYPSTDVVCNFVVKDVFNDIEYEGCSIDNLVPNTWNYVSFTTNIKDAGEVSVTITSDPENRIFTFDFRLAFEQGKIYTPYGTNHFARETDVIAIEGSVPSEDTYLLPDECAFYNGNTLISQKITAKDILRYKINQMYGSSQNEIYYNDCRGVISNAGVFTFKYTKDGVENTALISQVAVGKKRIANGNTYVTKTNYYLNDENIFDLITKDFAGDECYRINRYDDKFDLVYSVVDGISTLYSRNSAGLVVMQTTTDKNESNPIVTSCTYDTDCTKLLSTTDEFGNVTEYTTDDVWGVVTGITFKDANGAIKSIVNDTFDDDNCTLKSRVFSNGTKPRSTSFDYDKGHIKTLTHGNIDNSISFGFGYDEGKLTSVSKGTNTIEEHVHTDTTLDSYYPKNDSTKVYSTECTFDKYGRLTDVDGLITNTYDPAPMYDINGNLEEHPTNASAVLATSEDLTNNQTSKYRYDEIGRMYKKQVENASGTVISEETFSYDGIGRLTDNTCTYDMASSKSIGSAIEYEKEATDPLADGAIKKYTYKINGVSKAITEYRYDAFNRNDKKTYELSGRTFSKEITFTKTRPTTVIDKSPTSTIGNTSYTYDAMGRIKSIDNGESITYEYDSYGQLEKETNNILDKTIEYEYNEIGNLLSVTTTPFGGTATTTTFTYGNTSYPDRLTAYNGDSILYDTLGRPIAHGYHSYAWNKDKLSRIYRGSMSQPGTLYEDCRFTYNAFGQRISKNYIYDVNPASTSDYSYTYDTTYDYDHSGRLIRELISERFTYTGGSSATRELVYLYDESGVIGVIHYVNGTLQGTYYYRRNLQGDVVGIYKANGELVTEYAYDAYGNCTIKQGANNEISRINPIRYRGYYLDRETNLYYLNARYYNPEWRRFISPDDTAYLDPESVNGLNLYCYCGNDPVNYSDPSGHEPEWWQWALFGIGVALVAVAAGMAILGTGGVAAFGMGALIGSAAVGTLGAGIGAAVGYATNGTEGILGGAMAGFGIGAIVGFVVGGTLGHFVSSIQIQVDINKFTNYALDPIKSKGKHAVFNALGYNQLNAEALVRVYKVQGLINYLLTNYSLSTSDQYGQRITMGIRVGGEVLKTVWMLLEDGIRLITPFSGFGK